VNVNADLTLLGHPEVFVIGDVALAVQPDGRPAPGLAPAAKQMGAYVARVIRARAESRPPPGPFRYRHEGDLATVGRKFAIVKLRGLELTGLVGWLVWGAAHIYFLIGVRNRLAVAFNWLWEYLTFGRRSRLITETAVRRQSP
jgi:NADH dehydrogenase